MRRSPTAISERNAGSARDLRNRCGTDVRAEILGGFRALLLCSRRFGALALDALSGTCVPKLSLPVRLALLVAGTTLPLIVFAAGIVFNNYEQDRKDATQRVLETVRSIRLVLDAEMQRMTGGLQVLALTNALRNGDFDEFPPHRRGLSRAIWQGRRRAGGRPRGPPAVFLGHGGYRQPAAAQQPRHRREGVRDQDARNTPTCSSAR